MEETDLKLRADPCVKCDGACVVQCPHCDGGCESCIDAVEWSHRRADLSPGQVECQECDGLGHMGLEGWADQCQQWHWGVARSIRLGGDEASPIAFVVADEGILPIARAGATSAVWANAIRTAVDAISAKLVLLITEGWIPKPGLEELGLAVKLAGGRVQDIDHDEVLLCTSETSWGETRTLRARITDGVMGETEDSGWVPVSESAGTLTGFWGH